MNATQTKPDIEGLKKVVEAVRRSDNGSLYMGAWEDNGVDCGFAGCAIGWHCHVNRSDPLKMVDGSPQFSYLTGWEAVEARFNLSSKETDYLFWGPSYAEPSRPHVIARLEQFIREHEGT